MALVKNLIHHPQLRQVSPYPATSSLKERKMRKIIFGVLAVLFIVTPVVAADGVIDVLSANNVEVTADKMESILNKKGMTIFNRISHSQNAANIGIKLRKTELIIFGNPKVGSPLMECQQSVAIDLPQKALIWEDDKDQVRISYNDPRYLEKRHNINGCKATIAKIEKALAGITKSAATK